MLTLNAPTQTLTITTGSTNYSGTDSDDRLIELWIHDKAKSSQRGYKRIANEFLSATGKGIREVSLNDFYIWVDSFSPELKPATVKNKINSVKSLLSFAQKLGYVPFNVGAVVKPPEVHRQLYKMFLKRWQIEDMIDCAKSDRDKIIIKLGFIAGLRVAEIAGLTWGCLWDGKITFVGKGDKQRGVLLPPKIVSELLEFKGSASDDDPMFQSRNGGKSLTTRQITRIVKAAAVASGNSENVSAHWLRHSHANEAFRNGSTAEEVRDTLGHASISTTCLYLHSDENRSSAMALDF